MDLELQENVAFYLGGQKMEEEIIDPGMPLGACLFLTCKGCNKIGDVGCMAYRDINKLLWHRQGHHCPHNPPAAESKKQQFINPIKASKRGK